VLGSAAEAREKNGNSKVRAWALRLHHGFSAGEMPADLEYVSTEVARS